MHLILADYIDFLMDENTNLGKPVQRAMLWVAEVNIFRHKLRLINYELLIFLRLQKKWNKLKIININICLVMIWLLLQWSEKAKSSKLSIFQLVNGFQFGMISEKVGLWFLTLRHTIWVILYDSCGIMHSV